MKKKKNWLRSTIAIVGALMLIGVSSAAHAATTYDIDEGKIIGIGNLELNFNNDVKDGFYNISFVNDLGGNQYGPDDPVFDVTEGEAIIILPQINAAINDATVEVFGASSSGTQTYYIPGLVGQISGNYFAVGGENIDFENVWGLCEARCTNGLASLEPDRAWTFARVESSVIPVPAVVASSLPSSRSVQVGNLASVFATMINGSATAAIDCSLTPQTSVAADFAYWTTDAANVPTGSPNTPASIPGNGSQNFIFGFAPTAPISPTEVLMTYDCANTDPAPVTVGVNTLLLSAEATPVPDIVALAATATADGIVDIPGSNGSNAFAVSTVNVGSTATITASARTSVTLPLVMSICETNPGTGVCLSAPAASATSSVSAGATPTYSVFVTATGDVPFDAATNRIIVEFRDAGGVVRGSTSVAVRTQ